MADDRMRNDDREKNMGGQNKENFGGQQQQTPGRNKQDDDLQTGQRGAHEGRGGQENEPGHNQDDLGTGSKTGKGQGGQNRGDI